MLNREFSYNQSVIMIVISGLLLSFLGIGTRLMESADNFDIIFYRAIGALVFMLFFIGIKNRKLGLPLVPKPTRYQLIGALLLACASLFLVSAIMKTTVANAMFIVSLAPLLAAIFGRMIIGEIVRFSTWVTIAMSITGVLIMLNSGLTAEGVLGMGLAFAMSISYALFTVLLRYTKDLDMLPTNAYAATLLLLIVPLFDANLRISLHDLIICLMLGMIQMGIAIVLFITGAKKVPAAQVTILAMLEVVLAPVWVWLIVGETASPSTLLGGCIIIGAISILAIYGSKTANKYASAPMT